jgi:hypothetical protein
MRMHPLLSLFLFIPNNSKPTTTILFQCYAEVWSCQNAGYEFAIPDACFLYFLKFNPPMYLATTRRQPAFSSSLFQQHAARIHDICVSEILSVRLSISLKRWTGYPANARAESGQYCPPTGRP